MTETEKLKAIKDAVDEAFTLLPFAQADDNTKAHLAMTLDTIDNILAKPTL